MTTSINHRSGVGAFWALFGTVNHERQESLLFRNDARCMGAEDVTTGPSNRVRVRRNPNKERYDAVTIGAILDRGLVAFVAFVADHEPVCLPTLCARVDDMVYIHGSKASRAMQTLARGDRVCLTVTHLQGIVLARSAFEHTVNYESVVAFGRFVEVEGEEERFAALRAFTEKLLPGRWSEVRSPNQKELRATMVLRMTIEEASAKVRSGPPDDDETPDALLDTWAGEVPLVTTWGTPLPSPGLRPTIAISESVNELIGQGNHQTPLPARSVAGRGLPAQCYEIGELD